MFRVALIYPPGGDPRAPRLPLPALAAVLRQAGISVDLFDLDLEGVLSLLRPDRLVEAGAIIRQRAQSAGADERYFLERSASRAPALAESIAAALATIRNPEQFFEPTQLNCARERIYDSLDIVS